MFFKNIATLKLVSQLEAELGRLEYTIATQGHEALSQEEHQLRDILPTMIREAQLDINARKYAAKQAGG